MENFWIDVEEVPESPAHGIVDHDLRNTRALLDLIQSAPEGWRICHIAGYGKSVRKFSLEIRQSLGRAREHSDLITAFMEPPDHSRAGAGPDARYYHERFHTARAK